jgi:predicted MPP superfamily phosphohydrolase
VHELLNSAVKIERSGAALWFCGVDDWLSGRADVAAAAAIVPLNEAAILLAHEPDFAEEVAPWAVSMPCFRGIHMEGKLRCPL